MSLEDSEAKSPGRQETSTEQEIQQVHTLLQTLKGYETDRPHGLPDEVDTAISIIKNVCTAQREIFDHNGLVPTVHGSLQYHDPRNLDVDLTMFSYDELPWELFMDLNQDLSASFDALKDWPRGMVTTDFSFIGVNELVKQAEEIESPAEWWDVEESMAPDFTAMLLSCSPIFPDQQELYRNLQNEGWKLLHTHPTLRKRMIIVLENTVAIRKERRQNLSTPE